MYKLSSMKYKSLKNYCIIYLYGVGLANAMLVLMHSKNSCTTSAVTGDVLFMAILILVCVLVLDILRNKSSDCKKPLA